MTPESCFRDYTCEVPSTKEKGKSDLIYKSF
jgi:hypothetical protein